MANSSNPNPNTNIFGFSSYQSGSGFDSFSASNLDSPQYALLPFFGSHFSSPSPGLEGINLNESFDETIKDLGTVIKGSYTDAETKCLVRTWVDISADSIVENAQKDSAYWKQGTTRYHEIIPDKKWHHEKHVLKCHWQRVAAIVKKFHGYYTRNERLWQSGLNDRDIINRAKEEYKQNKQKIFKLEAIWDVLRSCPKFWDVEAGTHSSKKGKNNVGEGFSSESSVPTEVELPHPIGTKQVLKKGKKKKKKKKEEVVAAAEHIADKLDVLSEKLSDGTSTMKEMTSTFSQKFEYDIMTNDMTDMLLAQLAMHLAIVAKMTAKWGIE